MDRERKTKGSCVCAVACAQVRGESDLIGLHVFQAGLARIGWQSRI